MSKEYFVYIATNRNNTVLYTGMTNKLKQRMWQHKTRQVSSFSAKYNVQKLVFFEEFEAPEEAIAAEKKIEAGSRQKKVELIEEMNPGWQDLIG